jgi:putative hemolysin
MQGIREAMMLVKSGSPLGFFPAGAVSKVQKDLHIRDREWQSSIIRLVKQLKVPVVPIYFHGHNSTWFNILGMISWKLRTLRLPAEVFRRRGKSIHMSIGEPITVEEQTACPDMEALGKLLRERTYALEKIK